MVLATYLALAAFSLQSPSEELKKLAEEDQKDRANWQTMTIKQMDDMSDRDSKRRASAKELIIADKLTTADDFDHAALLFQHGDQPDDYLVARELAILACMMGKYGNMPALAEDRFLMSIGRKQRFGSQLNDTAKTDTRGQFTVTDFLRSEYMLPPLAEAGMPTPERSHKMVDVLIKRLELKKGPATEPLAKAKSDAAGRALVLKLYHENKLATPMDYLNAARILSAAMDSNELLLANEFAALACMRRAPGAFPLFAQTWDKYAKSIGQPARYRPPAASVGPRSRKSLAEDK